MRIHFKLQSHDPWRKYVPFVAWFKAQKINTDFDIPLLFNKFLSLTIHECLQGGWRLPCTCALSALNQCLTDKHVSCKVFITWHRPLPHHFMASCWSSNPYYVRQNDDTHKWSVSDGKNALHCTTQLYVYHILFFDA